MISARDKFENWSSWVMLSKIRNSFLSKATTALSLATFGLANLAKPLNQIGVDVWRMKLLFIGSVLFLLGYTIVLLRIPSEFRAESDPDSVVDRMLRVHGWDFFRSRLKITRSIVARYESKKTLGFIVGPHTYASQQVAQASRATEANWIACAAGLYHSDLMLRQFDRPWSRYFIFFLLLTGITLLVFPTLVSVYIAVLHLD